MFKLKKLAKKVISFSIKKKASQLVSTKERLRVNSIRVEAREDRKIFMDKLQTWLWGTAVVLTSFLAGVLFGVYKDQPKTVRELIADWKYLESKGCANHLEYRFINRGTQNEDIEVFCNFSSVEIYDQSN